MRSRSRREINRQEPEVVAAIVALQLALEREHAADDREVSGWKMRGRPSRPWDRNRRSAWRNQHSKIRAAKYR
ncbi:MAG: hypothetical protein ACOC9Y_10550 [Chloroflexota bacterium]